MKVESHLYKNIVLVSAMIFSIVSFYTNITEITGESFYTTKKGGKDSDKKNKIYDISCEYLPDYSKLAILSDIYTVACLLPVFSSSKLFIEFSTYFFILFSLRAVTINLTILPKHESCNYKKTLFGGCHDHIFSGHTASVFLASMLYYKYNMFGLSQLIVANIVNMMLILLVRYHYTIDVFLAPIIVFATTKFFI